MRYVLVLDFIAVMTVVCWFFMPGDGQNEPIAFNKKPLDCSRGLMVDLIRIELTTSALRMRKIKANRQISAF
jgi:hypothetical protein